MVNAIIPLRDVAVGDTGIVCSLLVKNEVRRRLLDLGLIIGTKVKVLSVGPFGDPVAYFIRGTVIALRSEETSKIMVKQI